MITVYHGSNKKFDNFSEEHIGKNEVMKFGWGMYFSKSEEIARQYYTPSGILLKCEIPSSKYLDLDDYTDSNTTELIYNRLKKSLKVSEGDLNEFQVEFMSNEYETTNKDILHWLEFVLKSEKNATKFLSDLGYTGSVYRDITNSTVKNYVIFNTKDIHNIINVEEENDYDYN